MSSLTGSPQTTANEDRAFTNDAVWATPNNAQSSNDTRTIADVDSTDPSDYLNCTNFTNITSPPAGTVIQRIIVRIERQSESTNCIDETVQLIVSGSRTGSNQADTLTDWPTSDTVATYSFTPAEWGVSNATSILTSTFGVSIAADNTHASQNREARIDHVEIEVEFVIDETGLSETITSATSSTETASLDETGLADTIVSTTTGSDVFSADDTGLTTTIASVTTSTEGLVVDETGKAETIVSDVSISEQFQLGIEFKWSDIETEAVIDGRTKILVDVSSSPLPTSILPDAGVVYSQAVLNSPSDSIIEELQFDDSFGIAGLRSARVTVDNSGLSFKDAPNLMGAYARVRVVGEKALVDELNGRITKVDLGLKTTLRIDDVPTDVFATELPKRTVTTTTFPNATDLDIPIPIVFGRAVKLKLPKINTDDLNREYDWLLGEGVGLSAGNFNDVFTVYRNDSALLDIAGDADGSSANTLELEIADRQASGFYNYFWAEITGGAGVGQIKHITSYDGDTNTATLDSSWATLPETTGLYFNGSSTVVDCGNPASLTENIYAIELQFKLDVLPSVETHNADLVMKDGKFSIYIDNADDTLKVWDFNAATARDTGQVITTGRWYHVFFFVSNGTTNGEVWLDGELVLEDFAYNDTSDLNNLFIGSNNSTNWTNGWIREVRYWGTSDPTFMDAADIALLNVQNLPTTVRPTKLSPLRHYWPLDDGSGTVAANPWGALDGTITGGTWTGSQYKIREWRFFDGSQGSPYAGYAFIRTKKNFLTGSIVDPLYADVNGLQTEKNFVRAVESILTNSTWGLGLTVDATDFTTAATDSGITPLLCEFAITQQNRADDIITNQLLTVRDMMLTSIDDDITIEVDTSKSSSGKHGLNDSEGIRDVITEEPVQEFTHLRDRTKDVIIKYRKNYKENNKYLQTLNRTSHSTGKDLTFNLDSVYDHSTADRIGHYKSQRQKAFASRLPLTFGIEGLTISNKKMIELEIPEITNGYEQFECVSSVKSQHDNNVVLVPYIADTYNYVASGLPPDESFEIPTDFTNTAPTPISNLSSSTSTEVQPDESAKSTITLTWTEPEENYSQSRVLRKKTSDSVYNQIGTGANSFEDATVTPGISYDYQVVSLNEGGTVAGGAVFELGVVAGGDITAPSTPTGLTAINKFGMLAWEWNRLTDTTMSHYIIEVYTASSGGTLVYTEKILQPQNSSDKPRSKPFNAQTGNLTTNVTRYAQVKAVDYAGNESAFTSRVSASTNNIARLDVGNNELQGVSTSSNTASLDIATGGLVTIISTSITRNSKPLLVHAQCAIHRVSGPGAAAAFGIELKRGSTRLAKQWAQTQADGDRDVVAFNIDDNGSGTVTYKLESDSFDAAWVINASERFISVTEKKNAT